jgi:ZIP family zinc transporter
MDTLSTTLMGFMAGVGGTGAGGFYTFFMKDTSGEKMSEILGFSGGVMLVAVFMELIPEALRISGLVYTLIGIIIGIAFLMVSEWMIESLKPAYQIGEGYFARAGILLFLAIACHNFPEGLAIGGGYEASEGLGFLLAVALAVHNIPEGMAVATAFRLSGMARPAAFISTLMAGIPMGVGTLMGRLLGGISPMMITASLGFAAGAMIYTVCEEILPDIFLVNESSPRGLIWGLVSGVIFFSLL